MKARLEDLIYFLREDALQVRDPKAEALFSLSAEVLQGVYKAFQDFELRNEAAEQGSLQSHWPVQKGPLK